MHDDDNDGIESPTFTCFEMCIYGWTLARTAVWLNGSRVILRWFLCGLVCSVLAVGKALFDRSCSSLVHQQASVVGWDRSPSATLVVMFFLLGGSPLFSSFSSHFGERRRPKTTFKSKSSP
ncbi:expressed unknown protein [Seminavis robusta]|uniref:Transmembrane protein n=1 Tax=Seminavis robusta TaxID=568900 RepID=A0A9N8DC12_9STRA|nr:expressed unknown protein [Seminavis robusta]|eukprot:Sro53_g031610.1 n/a (121) ;mRNA; r:133293-133971